VVQEIVDRVVLLAAALGLVLLGWRVAHRPDKAYRMLTFGLTVPNRFGIAFFRIVGWCWAVGGILGAALYAILIIIGMLRVFA
jgi:hypothetical protein